MTRNNFNEHPRFDTESETLPPTESKGELTYLLNVNELVTPYINPYMIEADKIMGKSIDIATILDYSDDDVIERIHGSNLTASHIVGCIESVREMIDKEQIEKEAPWYETLVKKMAGFDIYGIHGRSSADIEEGNKEMNKITEKVSETLRQFLDRLRNGSESKDEGNTQG